MKNIISFELFEAVQTKAIDVDNEQKNQAKLNDQIKVARFKMSKIDAMTNKKQFEKTQMKSQLTATIAKLTAMLSQSINKEAQDAQALSKEQSKQ
jgi:hypothetical protein